MRTLFIDTHSKYLNLAIIEDDKILYQLSLMGDEHSKVAVNEISIALNKCNLSPNDIDNIINVNGPGSFTGVRIGVTISKVYGFALNKKIYTISSLKAYSFLNNLAVYDYIVSMIDARRGYVFGAIYDKMHNLILEERYMKKDDLMIEVEKLKNVVYVSYDYDDIALKPDYDYLNLVGYVLGQNYVNPHELLPVYLKKTEAEENLNDQRS